MAEYPAMPLFTDAYMADTRHLTAAQHGAYLLLLMTAWRMPDCSLPNDDVFLMRCAAMNEREWKVNKNTVLSFWKLGEDARWRQLRLLDERKFVDEQRSKNSRAGKASALKRNNRGSTSVPTKLQHNPQHNSNVNPTPTPTPTPTKKETNVSKKGCRFDLEKITPEWIQAAKDINPSINATKVFEEFKDYWIAKPGKDGMKADWLATWRNWLRRIADSMPKTKSPDLFSKPKKEYDRWKQ